MSLAPAPLNMSLGISQLGIPKILGGFELDKGAILGEVLLGVLPAVNFHPLLCHHTQNLLGFSVPLQIPLADFAQLLGLALLNIVVLVLWLAQLMFPFEECLCYLLESLCPVT